MIHSVFTNEIGKGFWRICEYLHKLWGKDLDELIAEVFSEVYEVEFLEEPIISTTLEF